MKKTHSWKEKYLNIGTVCILTACVLYGVGAGIRHGLRAGKSTWKMQAVRQDQATSDDNMVQRLRETGGL
mgnify:FL=1